MKKAIILFLCLFSGIISAQTLWGGFLIDIKNAAGDTVSTTNLQAVKTFVGGGGGGSVATDAIWDAKGDLAVGTGANTAARLAVGTDGKQVYADADESTGLRWGAYVISPSQITSDQDDYAPTGWDEAQIVRISSDVDCHAITSFAATFDGDIKRILNVGSYSIILPPQHPDGTAANRIADYWSVYLILPGKAVEIMYDGTSSRWRIMSLSPPMTDIKSMIQTWSAGSVTVGDWGSFTTTVAGTGAGIGSSGGGVGRAAYTSLTTGTTTTGSAAAYFSKTTIDQAGFQEAYMAATWFISAVTLSDATNTYTLYFTLDPTGSSSTLNNNSIGIRYTHGENSGNWTGFSKDNAGAETTVDLGITVAANTPYLLRTEVNTSGTEAYFFVDGLMVGRVNANMPNNVNAGQRALILKSAGTTMRNVYLHSFNFLAIYP